MKKYVCLFLLLACASVQSRAQDDDIYFVPSKEEIKKAEQPVHSEYDAILSGEETENWAEGRGNGHWDVDDYNRRGEHSAATAETDSVEAYDSMSGSGEYTTRIVRFHSPRVGIYVSSPYYVDVYDYYWNDPWFYNPWYNDYFYWGWRPYAWGGWHSWHCWYDPWYHGSWGWHPHYYPTWGPPRYAYRGPGNRYGGRYDGVASRPSSGRYFSTTGSSRQNGISTSSRPSQRYNTGSGSRPSRNFGTSGTTRPSRNYGTSGNSRPTGTSGNVNSGSSRPSRSFGNSSSGSSSSRPSSSYSSSRSFGSGSSIGSSSRSGGGRSFGGRR